MLPKRGAYQPRVSCDEYEQGSCRWYDEWNYDHLLDYTANLQNLLWFAINDENKLKETVFQSSYNHRRDVKNPYINKMPSNS